MVICARKLLQGNAQLVLAFPVMMKLIHKGHENVFTLHFHKHKKCVYMFCSQFMEQAIVQEYMCS